MIRLVESRPHQIFFILGLLPFAEFQKDTEHNQHEQGAADTRGDNYSQRSMLRIFLRNVRVASSIGYTNFACT